VEQQELESEDNMLRSIGKSPGESVESVPEKKRKAAMGRICRKGPREDREKWRKYTSMVRPILGSRTAKEQNRSSYYNAKNNARCTQAIKTTHSLDRQHQDADRTPWKSQSE